MEHIKDKGRTNRGQSPQGCYAGSSGRERPSASSSTTRLRQSQSPETSSRRSRASTRLTPIQPSHPPPKCHTHSQPMWWDSSRAPSNACDDSVNRNPWACVQSSGTILAPRQETVICFLGSLPTSPRPPSWTLFSQVTPLAKRTGGHRPLLMMSFLRRLALTAIIAASKPSVMAAADPLQPGVDDQIHPVPGLEGSIPERVQASHATQPQTTRS